MGNAVDAWLDSLSPENRAISDRLREIVRRADADLTETIKWNAPSFADGDQDRITLGIERRGGARVVLHRGAAIQDASEFTFDDPERVAKWPTKDRGVATFADLETLDVRASALEDLLRRWVDRNRSAT